MCTSRSPQNSHRICRHGPHGAVMRFESAATTIASKPASPSESALNTATRSAHIVSPKEAFSMLQPVTISPACVFRAAPTLKRE